MITSNVTTNNTKPTRYAARFGACMLALVAVSVWPTSALAQDFHMQMTPQQTEMTTDQQGQAAALIQIVRDSTDRFKSVAVAMAEGYALQFGCVSGADYGAMGLHYVNANLVNRGVLDPTRPQIVIYEAMPDGKLKLIGADYLVIAGAWDKKNIGPPQLMGQLFHLFDSPNRFGLPAFYSLHVWAWKDNPNGAFVNWHPQVSCESFVSATPQPPAGQ